VEGNGQSTMASRRGRPQTSLALNPAIATVLTMVMTVHGVRAAVFDYSGRRLSAGTVDLEAVAASQDALVSAVIAAGREALKRARPRGALRHVAVGVQGMADAQSRSIMWSPFTPLKNVPLADALETAVESLRRLDPGRHGDNFMALLQAEGIGMGLNLKGSVFSGARSSASEFGHMVVMGGGSRCRCGRHDCIEAYASSYAIWRRANREDRDVVPDRHVTASEIEAIAAAARAGDPDARAAFAEAGRALGLGLGNLFALTDPVAVSIVGSGANAFDLIEPTLRQTISGTFSGNAGRDVSIACYPDEQELTEDGCRITALTQLDRDIFSASDLAANAAE
jgi:predicted NBD/HSP70 family sugar kinase